MDSDCQFLSLIFVIIDIPNFFENIFLSAEPILSDFYLSDR